MNRFHRLFFLLALTMLGACSTGTREVFSPFDLADIPDIPEIRSITFDENPLTKPPNDSEICAPFSLTENEVREFFRVARKSNSMEQHEFTPSGCEVLGNVILTDDRKAFFSIDRNRTGSMFIERYLYLFFFCEECKSEKYEDACDIDCLRADE
jgi:hypothetical protein